MQHTDPFAARVCPHCDGFASAAFDLGFRDVFGERVVAYVDCPACWGWGAIPRKLRTHKVTPAVPAMR